jgi:hypothetical protein
MSRGLIPPDWFDSQAFAAVTMQRHGRTSEVELVMERVTVAGSCWAGLDVSEETVLANGLGALADFAVAIGRTLADSHPIEDQELEFAILNPDGTVQPGAVDPAMFQTDLEGRAAVWASQAAIAGVRGDSDMVNAYADALVLAPLAPVTRLHDALIHVRCMILAAAPLAADQLDRANERDVERILSGAAVSYAARCADGCGWETRSPYRANRDLAAADHVLDVVHRIERGERWAG